MTAAIIQDSEGAVDHAPYPDRRDVPDAYGLDMLSLPPAAQLHPVGVDGNDVVAARRRLGYRWFQMLSILYVPHTVLRGRTPKTRSAGPFAADTGRRQSPAGAVAA